MLIRVQQARTGTYRWNTEPIYWLDCERQGRAVPSSPDPFRVIPPDVLTTEQVSERLGFNEVTIRKWINDGTLPAKLLGREYRLWWPSVVISLFYNGENDDHAEAPAPPPKPVT